MSGHDPLCEWSTPCVHGENQQHFRDTENLAVPDATYCWMCGADCLCDLIAKVREDMLATCIEVVRSMTIQFVGNSAATRDQVVDLLSALLVPATFVYTPACEFGLCDSCAYATECTCECHRLRALEEKP